MLRYSAMLGAGRQRCFRHAAYAVLLQAAACRSTTAIDARPVAQIRLGAVGNFALNVGQSTQLVVTLLDSASHELTDRSVTYASSDTSVAVVDGSGMVWARATGITTLAASSGSVSARQYIGVAAPPPLFSQVDVGGSETCALTPSARLYCWRNFIGPAAGSAHGNPQPVVTSGTFNSITVGVAHQCALTDAGAAYCWGDNGLGQLGTNDTVSASTPVAVAGGLVFRAISVGYRSTCGVTTGGDAYCWGSNASGQLGDGTVVPRAAPVRVASNVPFQSISVGYDAACAVSTAAAAYCRGDNRNGQLGSGATAPSTTPVAVTGGLAFSVVTAGPEYTCGLTTAGDAYCWGGSFSGNLGTGIHDTLAHPVPALVAGGLTWRALSAGDMTCGITSSDVAYCWGSNLYDLLASGTPSFQSSVPKMVWGGLRFSSVSARGDHACALAADGQIYCWGGYVS